MSRQPNWRLSMAELRSLRPEWPNQLVEDYYARGLGDLNDKMQWQFNGYEEGKIYDENDALLLDGWTMIANTSTSDYPVPVPIGPTAWAGQFADPPLWGSSNVTASELIYGQRYQFPQSGYVTGVRFWVDTVDPLVKYAVWLVLDPEGTPDLQNLIPPSDYPATGWYSIPANPTIVIEGRKFDVYVIKSNLGNETVFTYNWSYLTPNNETVPASGQIIQANRNIGELWISKTDFGGTDRSADLATVESGDLIVGASVSWTVQGATDEGTYINFDVTPAVQGLIGVEPFTFTVYGDLPIDYVNIPDHYLTNDQVEGFFSSTGADDRVFDQTAYGLDLQVQSAYVSESWDVVAPGSRTSGGSTGGAVQQLTTQENIWVQASTTSLSVTELMTVGSGWMEIGRLSIPLDTGFRVKFLATARREDGFGVFYGDGNYLIYNEGGSLTLKTLDENGESSNPVVGFNISIDGTDLQFEVRGMTNEEWHFRLLGFHREIL